MSASACSLGPLLLQPQGLKRAAGLDPEEALVEDLLGLASRIAADAVRGGTILTVLEQAVEAMGTRFLQGAAGGLQRAENHLRSLVEPAIRAMSDLARLLPDSQDPAQVPRARAAIRPVALGAEALAPDGPRPPRAIRQRSPSSSSLYSATRR